jgi:alpha-1,2-mannosyltransferase
VIKVIVRAARSALSILVCLILPLTTVVLVVVYGGRRRLAWDFQQAFLPAARAVLHGNDPYAATTVATLHNGTAYVYPPLAAYLLAPVAALPTFPAEIIATLAAAAAALLTLSVLGVRDWRCYGVALLWAPVVSSIHLGALSTFLALAGAVAWKWRRSPWIGGIAVAIAVATKLFMWPLLIWLCLIRLWRTAAVATLGTLLLVFGPWAASGFASIGRYPQILHASEKIGGPGSYTLSAAVERFGASATTGTLVTVIAALLCAGAAFARAGYQPRTGIGYWATGVGTGRERDVFALTIGLALLASPIMWPHYFALLLAVMPLYLPRLHPVWFAPVALLAFPITPNAASGWEVLAALGVAVVAVAAAAVAARPRPALLSVE